MYVLDQDYLAHASHIRVRQVYSAHFCLSHYTIYTPYIRLLSFRKKQTDAEITVAYICVFFSPLKKK